MKYDFNQIINRKKTNCLKWDGISSYFECEDLLPLWVADMDFPVAQPIVDALKKRAAHPFYGYTLPGKGVIESVIDRMWKKFKWKIKPEWILFTPGVVPALHVAVRSLTQPGDEILLQEPVYHPFFGVVKNSGCHIINNPLKLVKGRYEMDYVNLESKFHKNTRRLKNKSRIKAIIFCNPHNPVGRVWEKEEIKKMGEIVIGNGAVVISDEIHCEILFKGYEHISFATISPEFEQNCIVCTSPSKTFNLAGLEVSAIIIPNDEIRERYINTQSGIVPLPNLFGYTALEVAYKQGDEWLEQVMSYLQENLEFLKKYFTSRIPQIKIIEPQGTYLIWLDCRELGLDNESLKDFMQHKARVGLEDGYIFGEKGSGFMRMNIACPRIILEQAAERIEKQVSLLKK
ncbi:MAG: cystathionine beta-lyase [Methanobacterium sp.]|nr:MAG: cystathionine beta-lyase [Methanobacterium sp.]